jgi:large subunit ribosomal protein L11
MARQVTAQIKLQVPGGQATPAPPVGPALGQHGVNIGQFVSQFNDRSKDMRGITLPVVITVYSDRSFEFIIKSPPAAVLLKQAAGIPLEKKKGGEVINAEEKAKASGKYKGFKVSSAQVRDIAQKKLQDLNARDVDHAMRIIEGTARSLGLAVEG